MGDKEALRVRHVTLQFARNSPEVLEAMMTSAGAWRLTWASTRCFSSSCSGMFS